MVLSLTVLDDRRRKCFNPKAVSLYELNDSCWMHGRNVEKPFQGSLGPRAVPTVFAPHLTATPSRGHVGCTPPRCPLLRCLQQPNPLLSPALARDPSAEEHGCSSERWALQKDLSISSSSSWKIFFLLQETQAAFNTPGSSDSKIALSQAGTSVLYTLWV